jgi:hypothetical protein
MCAHINGGGLVIPQSNFNCFIHSLSFVAMLAFRSIPLAVLIHIPAPMYYYAIIRRYLRVRVFILERWHRDTNINHSVL